MANSKNQPRVPPLAVLAKVEASRRARREKPQRTVPARFRRPREQSEAAAWLVCEAVQDCRAASADRLDERQSHRTSFHDSGAPGSNLPASAFQAERRPKRQLKTGGQCPARGLDAAGSAAWIMLLSADESSMADFNQSAHNRLGKRLAM